MRKFFAGGPDAGAGRSGSEVAITFPDDDIIDDDDDKLEDFMPENPDYSYMFPDEKPFDDDDDDEGEDSEEEVSKLPIKVVPLEKIIERQKTEKFQQFVNEIFQMRRRRTLIWITLVFLFDVFKLTAVCACFGVICSIHAGVLKGAYILEGLIVYLCGLFVSISGEVGIYHLLFRSSGFAYAECRLNFYFSLMLIGCALQFAQLAPFGAEDDLENSYKFNNKGGQELCRQYAHRKLKISLCEERALCKAWADPHWLFMKIVISVSLCVNIISSICLLEYLCFTRYYYNPGRTVWHEYIQYRKFLENQGTAPMSPTSQKSPQLSTSPSTEGLTKTQSRILKKFSNYDPNEMSHSATHLHIDS